MNAKGRELFKERDFVIVGGILNGDVGLEQRAGAVDGDKGRGAAGKEDQPQGQHQQEDGQFNGVH